MKIGTIVLSSLRMPARRNVAIPTLIGIRPLIQLQLLRANLEPSPGPAALCATKEIRVMVHIIFMNSH